MKIHIEGDIWLLGDQYGCQVARRSEGKDGREIFIAISHWNNVQSAVEHGLLKLKLAESTAGTLKELAQEVRAYREFVREKIDF